MSDTTNDRPLNDILRRLLVQILIPVAVPVLVGIGSAAVTGSVMMVRLEERVATLERDMAKHEAIVEKNTIRAENAETRASLRSEDHERRLSKLETAFEGMHDDITEIKGDVKTLLRNGK